MEKYRSRIISAGGMVTYYDPANGTDFQLEELQRIVGGYIEIVYLNDRQVMVVNEEGKLNGLPVNSIATAAYQIARQYTNDFIVGDVLICDKELIK